MPTHTGQCLCGQVKYEIDGDPVAAGICHCKNCQRQTGTAFSTLWGVPKTALHFTAGKPSVYRDSETDSGSTVERWFCGNCGSPIYSAIEAQPDMAYLKTGTLDDTSSFAPQFHVWYASKQAWVEVSEDVPRMEKQS